MVSVGIFFLPRISRIFTDLVTCYPCPFVLSVGNVLFSHGFSRIFTDLVTCYPCSFVLSVGNVLFSHGYAQIFTDLVTCYPCPFVASVGNVLFSHGFHRFSQIWLHVIRAHLWHQWEMFFSPTDFTDLHGFGYMFSVFICGISGKYLSPTDFTDLHGFVFLVAANALGIGAASFWSVSGKKYSGKPDGDSWNAQKKVNGQQSTVNRLCPR